LPLPTRMSTRSFSWVSPKACSATHLPTRRMTSDSVCPVAQVAVSHSRIWAMERTGSDIFAEGTGSGHCPRRAPACNRRGLIVLVRTLCLHPGNVPVIWRIGGINVLRQRRHRAGVLPLMNFRMAIGESEAASAAMVTGRPVDDPVTGRVGVAIHFHDKVAIVDTIEPLVEENEGIHRPGVLHFQDLAINVPFA